MADTPNKDENLDIPMLAATIFGETKDPAQAVGVYDTMHNRSVGTGRSMKEIAMMPGEYQAYGKAEYQKAISGNMTEYEKRVYDKIRQALETHRTDRATRGDAADTTGGATHYHHNDITLLSPKNQGVFNAMEKKNDIGQMHTYREDAWFKRHKK